MTKKLFLLLISILLQYSSIIAQEEYEVTYLYTFDGGDTHFVEIDASNPKNIWQIGRPQKTLFNSAISEPNAIVTDTLNPYPDNNKSSFIIRVDKPINAPNDFCWSFMNISVLHRYNTDSLYSGGFIEISYDGGKNWINIIHDNYAGTTTASSSMYSDNDTIVGGFNAFTGNNENDGEYNYRDAQFRWMRNFPEAMEVDSCQLRFTFISDKNTGSFEGWMVDHINIFLIDLYHTSIDDEASIDNEVLIVANPVICNSDFTVKSPIDLKYNCTFYDLCGNVVKRFHIKSNESYLIKRDEYESGIYIYIVSNKTKTYTGKFIVN